MSTNIAELRTRVRAIIRAESLQQRTNLTVHYHIPVGCTNGNALVVLDKSVYERVRERVNEVYYVDQEPELTALKGADRLP